MAASGSAPVKAPAALAVPSRPVGSKKLMAMKVCSV